MLVPDRLDFSGDMYSLTCRFLSVQANGNWYEGSWRDDLKNGNGRFYYADKGQMYEGFWVDGVAKCGTMSDFGRNEAPTPTEYPIPKVESNCTLMDRKAVLHCHIIVNH